MKFIKKELKEVIPLLPDYAWLLNNYDRKNNLKEWEKSLILYYKGDLELENLDLDNLLPDEPETYAATILIDGNLKVKNIFNEETDGATGLIVLGNLDVDNVVVGGQEIIITNNLNVKGLYWGDYNHGNLIVKGEYKIKAFLATDYNFELGDSSSIEKNIKIFMYDEEDIPAEGEDLIKSVFQPSVLMKDINEDEIEDFYSWNDWVDRDEILEKLKNNENILLSE